MKIHQLHIFSLVFLLNLMLACNAKKVSNITVKNNNDFSIGIRIDANNIHYKLLPIEAGEKRKDKMDWTEIEARDGQYVISLLDAKGNVTQQYHHGLFLKGELYNYIDLEVEGSEVRVKIEN